MAGSQADAQGRDQRSQDLDSQHALLLRVSSLERELQDCHGDLEGAQVQRELSFPLAVYQEHAKEIDQTLADLRLRMSERDKLLSR